MKLQDLTKTKSQTNIINKSESYKYTYAITMTKIPYLTNKQSYVNDESLKDIFDYFDIPESILYGFNVVNNKKRDNKHYSTIHYHCIIHTNTKIFTNVKKRIKKHFGFRNMFKRATLDLKLENVIDMGNFNIYIQSIEQNEF